MTAFTSYGQDSKKVVSLPDEQATFGNGPRETLNQSLKIAHVIQKCDCRGEDGTYIAQVKADLVIDKYGKVLKVDFPDTQTLSGVCQAALRKEFLSMKGWKPGKVKGQSVISKTTFVISCIKWEEE